MQLSKILRVSTVAAGLMLVVPLSFAATTNKAKPVAAPKAQAAQKIETVTGNPAAMKKVVADLQQQIQKISDSIPIAVAKGQASNQKAIANFQKQTQAQISHLQAEIVKVQQQMSKEIAQVQKEVQQEAKIK